MIENTSTDVKMYYGDSKSINDLQAADNLKTAPSNEIPVTARAALQAEHNRLSAYLRDSSTAGTPGRHKVVLTHRALTQFLDGHIDMAALQARLAEIERG